MSTGANLVTVEDEMESWTSGRINKQINKQRAQYRKGRARREHWGLLYSNIRGFKGKRSSLIDVLNEEKPQVVLLTETLLKTNSGVRIEGYTFFGKARENKSGGGTGILVRNDIKNSVAPHLSDRGMELIWISVRRRNCEPCFIGCYYGKQESRCSNEEIKAEMESLSEEIAEMRKEGQIILFMDGNGKLGLLGEEKSRNGKLLEKVFRENDLLLMNESEKCEGKVTRKNTKNDNEKSAIDFVVASRLAESWIEGMKIDEEGLLKIQGKKETDHNTIMVKISIGKLDAPKVTKRVSWRLTAPPAKWEQFKRELYKQKDFARRTFAETEVPMDTRYKRWLKKIEAAAMKSIGKTTFKEGGNELFSDEVKDLRSEKRIVKKALKQNRTHERQNMIGQYRKLQEAIRN